MKIEKGKYYIIKKETKDYYSLRKLGLSFDVPKKCLFIGRDHLNCVSVLFEGQSLVNRMTEYLPLYTGKYYNIKEYYEDCLEEVKFTIQEELEI